MRPPSVSSWIALVLYFVHETLASVWVHRIASVLTVLIVAVGAFIFEAFALVSYNLSRVVERGGSGIFVELYFKEQVPEARQREMLAEFGRLPEVQAVRWTTKQQALESFRAQGYEQLLEGIEGNPLPPSIVLELQPRLELPEARALALGLGQAPEIAQWSDSGELAERLASLDSIVRTGVGLIGLFLGLMLALLIAGTVRLALDARRGEIEILELTGATPAFIRLPFVLEGTLLGGLAGLLSIGALNLLVRILLGSMDLEDSLLLGIGSLRFFDSTGLALCCALPAALGCLAGLLVTARGPG